MTALTSSSNAFETVSANSNEPDGLFAIITGFPTRAMCRTEEGVPLAKAAAVQPEFEFHDVSGTLVGFWTPQYAKTLNVPGYHLHFLSKDHSRGGHLLQCRGHLLRLQIQREGNYRIAFPENNDFINADLQKDPSDDLAKAESYHP